MNHLPTKGGYTVHGILSGGGGFKPTGLMHDVTGVPTAYPQIEQPEVKVPFDYGLSLNATGQPVKKGKKVSRYVAFNEVERKPGVFPTTIGDMGGAGLGIDSYHEFKPAEGLAEAMAMAVRQQDETDMPHQWVKPEHMFYEGDRTAQSTQDYFTDVGQDFQRRRIEKLMAAGYSEDEIVKVLSKEREKAIEKALKDPSNPAALLQATIAQELPDYLRPDYPVKIAPGAVPAKQNASFYELATGKMTTVERSKVKMRGSRNLAVARQDAMEEKDSKKLAGEFAKERKDAMEATLRTIPRGSYVLDSLARGGAGPYNVSFT